MINFEIFNELANIFKNADIKALAAGQILNSTKKIEIEALCPIVTGWECIKKADVILVKNGQDSILKESGLSEKNAEDLKENFRLYQNGQTEFADFDIKKYLKKLEQATAVLKKWIIKNDVNKFKRIFRKLKTAFYLIISAGILTMIFWGLYKTFDYPDKDEGLSADYYAKPDFTGTNFTKTDHVIDFDWKNKSPMFGIPADNFSVRWQGCILIDKKIPMFLFAGSDDEMHVYINNELFVHSKAKTGFNYKKSDVALKPGIYNIRIDYVEYSGYARAILGWGKTKRSSLTVIPAKNLIPEGGNSKYECDYLPDKEKLIKMKKKAEKIKQKKQNNEIRRVKKLDKIKAKIRKNNRTGAQL